MSQEIQFTQNIQLFILRRIEHNIEKGVSQIQNVKQNLITWGN